jgi:hypothetical protein
MRRFGTFPAGMKPTETAAQRCALCIGSSFIETGARKPTDPRNKTPRRMTFAVGLARLELRKFPLIDTPVLHEGKKNGNGMRRGEDAADMLITPRKPGMREIPL